HCCPRRHRGGQRTHDAIRGALAGGWINVLITDVATTETLAAHPPNVARRPSQTVPLRRHARNPTHPDRQERRHAHAHFGHATDTGVGPLADPNSAPARLIFYAASSSASSAVSWASSSACVTVDCLARRRRPQRRHTRDQWHLVSAQRP